MRPVDRHQREDALRAANRSRRGVRLPALSPRAARRAIARRTAGRGAGWLAVLPVALLLFLVLRTFVVEAFRIPSSSMERTLLAGDFLLVNKWVYGAEIPFTSTRLPALRPPRHGDVIVFDWPVDPGKAFVKRLVGLPGDTLQMRAGRLERNGRAVREPYVRRGAPVSARGADPVGSGGEAGATMGASRDGWGPLIVPPGHLFVLGDNRENSLDSRYWGFVPFTLLRGAPWLVYYSFTPDSTAPIPWLTRIRWGRIGTAVR